MGFFVSYFLSLLSFHTHTKSLPHYSILSLKIWKKTYFYLHYLKERTETTDEGAINLERQNHPNEI